MTTSIPTPTPAPNTAPVAFLRGIERRGAVLAELQAGDAAVGDAALAAAMAGFVRDAEALPIAQWPRAFWTGLLAQPALHGVRSGGDAWARFPGGPRAALLLRLAAGLDENEAASVLGVSGSSYRLALQQAVPRDATGDVDAAAWQVLRDQVQHALASLAPDRLAALADAREAAIHGPPAAAPPRAGEPVSASGPPRRLLAVLWALLVLCVLAFIATFIWPRGGRVAAGTRIGVEPLPPAEAPGAMFGADAALVSHRDFAVIVDPDGERLARDLGFYSWLAAGGDALPQPALEDDAPVREAAPLPLPLESADATL